MGDGAGARPGRRQAGQDGSGEVLYLLWELAHKVKIENTQDPRPTWFNDESLGSYRVKFSVLSQL